MKIKVIGKAHMEGTSKKTGRPYNLYQVHYNAPARGIEGVAARSAMIDPSFIPYDKIIIGNMYNLEFDNAGYVLCFDPV